MAKRQNSFLEIYMNMLVTITMNDFVHAPYRFSFELNKVGV
jgi:hypothetical protein